MNSDYTDCNNYIIHSDYINIYLFDKREGTNETIIPNSDGLHYVGCHDNLFGYSDRMGVTIYYNSDADGTTYKWNSIHVEFRNA